MAIENTNNTLLQLDTLENQRSLTTPENNFRTIIKKHLLRLLDYQKKYWKKRCTIRHINVGEANNKFFHAMVTEIFRRNSIASLQLPNGTIISDNSKMEGIILVAFKGRMGPANPQPMKVNLKTLLKKDVDFSDLVAPFAHKEIDDMVSEMPPDRAPGPDSFNGAFLKACWPIIKNDFYLLCDEFHQGGLNLESINAGFITLIPKVNSPECVNDFRPITLLNCCLKLITKILANRLQKIILRIVHRNQYGFLRGRSIHDCLAWAFEYIHQCQASKREIVLLKLDFAKAFDTIEHSAMLLILKNMGFPPKWLAWMESIFASGKSSVLLNGVPGRHFLCKCGVRQGDPLSPFLFLFVADGLSALLRRENT